MIIIEVWIIYLKISNCMSLYTFLYFNMSWFSYNYMSSDYILWIGLIFSFCSSVLNNNMTPCLAIVPTCWIITQSIHLALSSTGLRETCRLKTVSRQLQYSKVSPIQNLCGGEELSECAGLNIKCNETKGNTTYETGL